MKSCATLGIEQIFTSYANPKGNANTERVIRTLKEDLIWPREWYSYSQLETSLPRWIGQYNEDYPHSAIGHRTPSEFEALNDPKLDSSSQYREVFLEKVNDR